MGRDLQVSRSKGLRVLVLEKRDRIGNLLYWYKQDQTINN